MSSDDRSPRTRRYVVVFRRYGLNRDPPLSIQRSDLENLVLVSRLFAFLFVQYCSRPSGDRVEAAFAGSRCNETGKCRFGILSVPVSSLGSWGEKKKRKKNNVVLSIDTEGNAKELGISLSLFYFLERRLGKNFACCVIVVAGPPAVWNHRCYGGRY